MSAEKGEGAVEAVVEKGEGGGSSTVDESDVEENSGAAGAPVDLQHSSQEICDSCLQDKLENTVEQLK